QPAITFPTGQAEQDETGGNHHPPEKMKPGRLPHHLALRGCPVLFLGQPADTAPLPERRQLTVLPAGVPDSGPVSKQQFAPAPPWFLLFSGKPVPQGWDEVVVGQLVVFLANFLLRSRSLLTAFRVGRCDEAKFTVQNADEVIKIPGTAGMA